MISHDVFATVKNYFNDKDKAYFWFTNYCPGLNGIPINMIKNGQRKKVKKYVDSKFNLFVKGRIRLK